MKRIYSFIIALIMILTLTAVADSTPRLVDGAELLSAEEYQNVLEKLDRVSERNDADVVIVTTESLGRYNYIEDCAMDFYDYAGYSDDGMIFLIALDSREWTMLACGKLIESITDKEIAAIEDEVVPYLSDGDYETAFLLFTEKIDYYADHEIVEVFDPVATLLLSLIIGAIIALIVVLIMRSQLKSVKSQDKADNYIKANSFELTESRDLFLYKNIIRRERPKNNSGGSSSGGSFRSSSGRSFSGRSGRF